MMGKFYRVTSVAIVSGLSLGETVMAETDADPCALTPVFMEEFDTLSVSRDRIGPARWTAHTPWWGDFGDAAFTDPGPDGPFSIQDGILKIKAWKDRDGRWRSGLLAGADRWGNGRGTQYGYFETRIQFPRGPGIWGAFWLMPLRTVGHYETNIEIDVIEYYGHHPRGFQSVLHIHSPDPELKRAEVKDISVPKYALVEDFNTYGLDISPDWIVFLLNGEEVWRTPTPDELDYKMYPLVNLALGAGWPIDRTPDPSIMLVDYVRVYERGSATTCAPGISHAVD